MSTGVSIHTAKTESRFRDKVGIVADADACWEWLGAKDTSGYGQFRVGGKTVRAHRFAYELANGPIPGGLFACHKCDNRGCVNPDHIFLGTNQDNVVDMVRKGRHWSRLHPGISCGERNGNAKLTVAQVREIRGVYADGGISYAHLAKRLGLSKATIHDAVRGKTWKDVP